MRRWIIGAAAALAGAATVWTAPEARAFGPLVLDFENAASGDVSLVYTSGYMGPIPAWGFGQGSQVSAQVKRVKGSNVLGVRSNDSSTRVVVGIGTATGGGAGDPTSIRIVGTTSPARIIFFDRGGNVGPGPNGLTVPATGGNGSQNFSFGPGATGVEGDAVSEIVVVFGNGGGFVDDILFEPVVCGGEPPPPPPPPEDECDDWFTGGGWIYGTPTGAKATFGVGGGLKNGDLWGHLNWIDHGITMHTHWDEITLYTVVPDTNRRILEGTATINGEPGTFHLEIEDNGEPGRDDFISLSLSNGYSAAGTLDGGGNLQLHKPKCDKGGGNGRGGPRKRRRNR